jgi:replicative DNA helicase
VTDEAFERTPPHDLGAEQAALGGMLLSADAIADVVETIAPRDCYRPAHQIVYEAILDLYGRGEPADPVSVADVLARRGELARVGGAPYLHTLIATVPTAANAGYYARIVRDRAILRRLVEAGTRIVQLGYSADGDAVEAITDRARGEVEDAIAAHDRTDLRTTEQITWDVLAALEEAEPRGISTGYLDLTAALTGLAPGEFIVIAARPGIGKSVLGMNIAAHVAIRLGLPVLYSSLEMGADELMMRLYSAEARVPLHSILSRSLDDKNLARIMDAQPKIADAPLIIDDTPTQSLSWIRSQLRKYGRTSPPALLVVDYLGLIQAPKAESRQSAVAAISTDLKAIAREFQIPVVALHQLNRNPETRIDRKPMLADLRDSGQIEADADKVLLLHREDAYDRESPRAGEIDVIVAKQRQGPICTVTLAFQGHYARCMDMAVA